MGCAYSRVPGTNERQDNPIPVLRSDLPFANKRLMTELSEEIRGSSVVGETEQVPTTKPTLLPNPSNLTPISQETTTITTSTVIPPAAQRHVVFKITTPSPVEDSKLSTLISREETDPTQAREIAASSISSLPKAIEDGDKEVTAQTVPETDSSLSTQNPSILPPQEEAPPMERKIIEDYYDIDRSKRIGKGHYASVFAGIRKSDGLKVAVKMVEKRLSKTERLALEVDVMKRAGENPNIVQLIDVFETDNHLQLVLEFVEGGELFEHLVEHGPYSEFDAARHIRDVTTAIGFLHSKNIIHRDLKPENLLLTSKNEDARVKVADFGLAKLMAADVTRTVCGTWAYCAPEVKKPQSSYDNKCDVWSIGVIAFILLSAYHPFDPLGDASDDNIWKKIEVADYNFDDPAWDSISPEAKDFVQNVLVLDPKLRMSAEQALQHPWLKQPETPLPRTPISPSITSKLADFQIRSRLNPLQKAAQAMKQKMFTRTPSNSNNNNNSPSGSRRKMMMTVAAAAAAAARGSGTKSDTEGSSPEKSKTGSMGSGRWGQASPQGFNPLSFFKDRVNSPRNSPMKSQLVTSEQRSTTPSMSTSPIEEKADFPPPIEYLPERNTASPPGNLKVDTFSLVSSLELENDEVAMKKEFFGENQPAESEQKHKNVSSDEEKNQQTLIPFENPPATSQTSSQVEIVAPVLLTFETEEVVVTAVPSQGVVIGDSETSMNTGDLNSVSSEEGHGESDGYFRHSDGDDDASAEEHEEVAQKQGKEKFYDV